MSPYESFKAECSLEVAALGADAKIQSATKSWMQLANSGRYSYHFEWLGRPIIQYPQDIVAIQELIWRLKPDLIIETGIAHGGSLMLSASVLTLLDFCDAAQSGRSLDPSAPRRRVVGVDIDIRPHNRAAIEAHPLAKCIELIEGSSTDKSIVERIRAIAAQHSAVLVILDSNHTRQHVLEELEAYADLVSPGSYCIVMDTIIDALKSRGCSR